jgi:hypothetical protein
MRYERQQLSLRPDQLPDHSVPCPLKYSRMATPIDSEWRRDEASEEMGAAKRRNVLSGGRQLARVDMLLTTNYAL